MIVLMDEMHITESLVYDKVSGSCVLLGTLVGFANLRKIDTHLPTF